MRETAPRRSWPQGLLAVLMTLTIACHAGGVGRLAPTHYAQSFDSASNSCRTQPALCARMAGEEAIVPQSSRRLAEWGVSAAGALKVLNEAQRRFIEQKLTACANKARQDVLIQYMEGRSPTPEECREEKVFGGRFRTRARFLGEEMHRVALQCAGLELSLLHPGGYSIEPRYRYDRQTGQRELIPPEKEDALLEQGCYSELRGTIKPDIVIHLGNPLVPLAVYDYKFPCVDRDKSLWCKYTQGPHQNRWQNEVYREVLGVWPFQILPWLGVMP